MDLNRFLANRRPRWDRLEQLLERAERRGLANLAPAEAEELYRLYRLTSSDLNLAQTRTGNPAVLDALEALVGRAHAMLSVPRKARPFRAWWWIMRHGLPATARAERWPLALAAAAMLAGMIFGAAVTAREPGTEAVFLNNPIGRPHLAESPSERVARLEERQASTGIVSLGHLTQMSAFLTANNTRVTILAFGLGLTFGVGTVIMLFFNGAMLGSLGWLYWQDGVFTFFCAWVGPHGAIELPCILLGGAAGLIVARAQWRWDGRSVWQRIRASGRSIIHLLIGAATLLAGAALIEGGFSQITEPAIPYELKIAVAIVLFSGLVVYLFGMPVRSEPSGA